MKRIFALSGMLLAVGALACAQGDGRIVVPARNSSQPRVVVASHFDDFFRTLEQPAGFSLNVNLASFPEEVAGVSGEFAVAALPAFEAVRARIVA